MAAVTICSDFGAQENKVSQFPLFPHLFAMKWWDWIMWSQVFECLVLNQHFQLGLRNTLLEGRHQWWRLSHLLTLATSNFFFFKHQKYFMLWYNRWAMLLVSHEQQSTSAIYIYMYPLSPTPYSHLGWYITLSRVSCAVLYVFVGYPF